MANAREKADGAPIVPASMADAVAGYAWTRDIVGESGGAVHRLHGKPNAPDLFMKHGRAAIADDVTDEMVRLRWLAAHVRVPTVVRFVAMPDEAWLLMEALPGETAYECLAARPDARIAIVDSLAAFLRRLHAVAPNDCPFKSDHAYRLARARERIDAGVVDEDDFDEDREGWTSEQVWDALQQTLPLAPDRVVTHGDFSLGNILMVGTEVIGCIDAGRVGIADRYQDVAILWRCLAEFGAGLQDRLLARYGIGRVDRRRLRFHLLLDELF